MRKPIPRISTRGYYDLNTGKTIKQNKYFLYPKKFFDSVIGKKELVIMIHGLRNDKVGAINKFEITKNKLRKLGYKHPVVGFSYDSNTKGAHLRKSELRALRIGQKIAKKNGTNLAQFIIDFKKKSPMTKIRLIGHSLGTQVILSVIENLPKYKENVEAVYFFGSSISQNEIITKSQSNKFQNIVRNKIVNYFAPTDDVLRYAHKNHQVKNPIGLFGLTKMFSKYSQKKVKPENHRFASYVKTLKKFP